MITIRNIALATGLSLACVCVAGAQSPLGGKAFVNVNAGGQVQSRTISNEFTLPNIYGETASMATTTTIDGGPLFDLSLGYRFMPRIGVAIGFSSFKKTGAVAGAASVPSPIFFNQPASVQIVPRPAEHNERSVYLLVVGFVPVRADMDLALSVGPSVTRVTQDLITTFTVPAGTQSVLSPVENQSGTAKGINAGADLTLWLDKNKKFGIGGFARYNGGTVDLPAAPDLKVGGFQAGGGLRLKF